MLSDFLIALVVLTLLCLYGSGDRTGSYETHHYTRLDGNLFDD
jgi:hypothetical protein